MAENFLLACKEKLDHTLIGWSNIHDTLEYAFTEGDKIADELAKAVDSFKSVADSFRNSNKTARDVYDLFLEVQAIPWTVQERFLKAAENADIAELLKNKTKLDFERAILKECTNKGGDLLKKAGMPVALDDQEYTNVKQEHDLAWERFGQLRRLSWRSQEEEKEYDELYDRALSLSTKVKEERKIFKQKAEEIRLRIKENLLQLSSVSQEEAEKWVDSNVTLNEASLNTVFSHFGETAKQKMNIDTVKKELANIYRITNGKLGHIDIEGKLVKDGRSFVSWGDAQLIWADGDLGSLYHEVGHEFEFSNQEYLTIAERFVKDRATGKEKRLSTLTGDSGYKSHEKAYPDNFSNPYVGKLYTNENGKVIASEVLSMGLQILGNTDEFIDGLNDVEHLGFCFGCFTSEYERKVKPTTYHMEVGKDYSDGKKDSIWQRAILDACSESFVQKLFGKGVYNYKIIEDKEYECLELHHNRKLLYRYFTYYRNADSELLIKLAYCAICNYKKLVPYADPNIENDSDDLDGWVKYAPEWFTPLTELPRL